MKKCILLLLLALSCFNAKAQKSVTRQNTSLIEGLSISNLLPEGKYEVDIVNNVQIDERTQYLIEKLQKGIAKNGDWALKQLRNVKEGEPLPYDKRMGVTKAEYDELLNLKRNPNRVQMTKSSSDTIEVRYIDEGIRFVASGKLKILGDVVLNMSDSTANLGKLPLGKPSLVKIESSDNGLGSKWQGYTWEYQTSNKLPEELTSQESLSDLNLVYYKITIGKLESTGKTYIELKGTEVIAGDRKVRFQIPLVFK